MPLDQVSGELDRVEAALVSLPGHREDRADRLDAHLMQRLVNGRQPWGGPAGEVGVVESDDR